MTMEEVKAKKSQKSPLWRRYLFLAGVLVGLFAFFALRFVSVKSDAVHYHADFALYVNGQKDEFKSFTFYEEVQSCSADEHDNVKARAHMHGSKAGLIHVHDHGVTWGQFFANLSYTLGDTLVATDNGVFVDSEEGNQLTFFLNNSAVKTLTNQVIKNGDRLIINYGKETPDEIKTNYNALRHEADKANTQNDPATCSGSQSLTITDRLKAALGIKL